MKIADLYKQKKGPVFSVELIPPRNGDPVDVIDRVVQEFKPYPVSYYSVTWGAGGSLRGGTLPISFRIQEKYGVPAMAHFTCRDFSIQQVENILVDAKYLGIENILALRGDPPEGDKVYQPKADGYQYAKELVRHLSDLKQGRYLKRSNEKNTIAGEFKQGDPYPLCVAVAAHPEKHFDSPTIDDDRRFFKEKVDAGADMAVTQMVFSAGIYNDFLDDVQHRGVEIPVVPGVFIMRTYGTIGYILPKFGISLPPELAREYERCKDNPEAFCRVSVEHTVGLVRELLKTAPGVHFYSMNNSQLITDVLDRL